MSVSGLWVRSDGGGKPQRLIEGKNRLAAWSVGANDEQIGRVFLQPIDCRPERGGRLHQISMVLEDFLYGCADVWVGDQQHDRGGAGAIRHSFPNLTAGSHPEESYQWSALCTACLDRAKLTMLERIPNAQTRLQRGFFGRV